MGKGKPQLRLAIVGIWGRGYENWRLFLKHGKCETVALCDCDSTVLPAVSERLKNDGTNLDISRIPFYTDWRRMLDDSAKLGIQALAISTPDHMHVPIAVSAMRRGIHVYVEKPLARTLWELERFREVARDTGVITQMGNQGSSGASFRRGVEILRSGMIGDVGEVHVWTNRPVWPQGDWARALLERPADPVPAGLDWDAWIGTAAMRPYKGDRGADPRDYEWSIKVGNTAVYHRFNWRGYADFGTGALGDMAGHLMNLAHRGLRLGRVAWAKCRAAAESHPGIYPASSIVDIGFAGRPGLKLVWHDGGNMPEPRITAPVLQVEKSLPVGGCAILGSNGAVYSCNNYNQTLYIQMAGDKKPVPLEEHEACRAIPKTLPRRSEDGMEGNYGEFIDAILGETPFIDEAHSRCFCDIEHSVPMTEAILVACAAQRLQGEMLRWDAGARRFDNAAANAMISPHIRRGWEF